MPEVMVNRMSDSVAFQVPTDPDAVDAYIEAVGRGESPSEDVIRRLVAPALVAAVLDELGDSFTIELAPASYGRGAAGYGAVLQVVEVVAAVGGAATTLGLTAKLMQKAYRALRHRLGRRPLVSLAQTVQ